jgi:hypothetical protein
MRWQHDGQRINSRFIARCADIGGFACLLVCVVGFAVTVVHWINLSAVALMLVVMVTI